MPFLLTWPRSLVYRPGLGPRPDMRVLLGHDELRRRLSRSCGPDLPRRARGRFRPAAFVRGAIGPAALLLLSCADTTPAKISYSTLPVVIVDNSLHALDAAVVNKAGQPLGGQG